MTDASELYEKWASWLDRIETTQLRGLLIARHIFKQLLECTEPYVGSHRGDDLFHWMVQNYVAFASTAIRRMTEKPTDRWNSTSLRILLEDMAAHDAVLTRERFRSFYKNPIVQAFADRDFNSISRDEKTTHVSRAQIDQDIGELTKTCARVNGFVNKAVAHTEEDRRKIPKIKFGELDAAIDVLEATFKRYVLLVNGSVCNPLVPLQDLNVCGDLTKIWPEQVPAQAH